MGEGERPAPSSLVETVADARGLTRPSVDAGAVTRPSLHAGAAPPQRPLGEGGAPPPAAAMETLLHYRVLEKLGEGGMGAVFRAEDQRLGRVVAIKRLRRDEQGGEMARQRLVREARIASAVSHPNIVTIFAIEESERDTFIVMEHLQGETLATLIARGPLAPARVAAIGAEIADALACAHAAGLIHRDVKPQNVIISPRGNAKVLDFGIAKRDSPDALPAFTQTGAVQGTVAYMAPEQLCGQPLDGRCDLFALGALLYEAATGKRAFPAGDLGSLVQQILTGTPTPPEALAPGLPPALSAIILRALAKEPSHRFGSAAEMGEALRGLDGGAAPATTPSAPRDAPRSVAVLPFLDLSAARDQDYLCDGIAEEVLTSLSQVDGLRVAARSSSFKLKAQDLDARTAGERLGVDAVLEGAVRKAGDRLRVTVQLVDVAGGYQRWSRRFDGDLADVFDIQDAIASAVATELRGALGTTSQRALRRPETTPEAYECFLRGRQLLHNHDEVLCGAAARALGRAVALDPTYVPAYAALAQVHAFIAEWYGGGESAREAADRASARAVELGPDLAEAHVARAAVLAMRQDYPAAERAYQEAIRRSPRSFDAHYHLARVYVQTGQEERAAESFRRAADLQADDFQCLILAVNPLRHLGRQAEADASRREGIRRAERVLEIDPTNTRALSLGACALAEEGDAERAIAWCERAIAVASDDLAMSYNAACVYARLGRRDEAIDRLERSFARGNGKRDWIEHDADWDPYRDDPRFQALLAKLS